MNASVFPPELLDAVEALGTRTLSCTVWRQTLQRRDGLEPDHLAPNTKGARWNFPGLAALYTAYTADCAAREIDYLLSLQPRELHPLRYMVEVSVTAERVVDLSHAAALRSVGLSAADVKSNDHQACRLVGGAVHYLECDALIVPSARCDGSNLVILTDNIGPDFGPEIVQVTGPS